MYRTLTALVVTLAAATSAHASVTVNGHGQITVKPDTAHINVGVNTNGKTAAGMPTPTTPSCGPCSRARRVGLSDRDLQSNSYHVGPVYRTKTDGTRELTGYEVRHMLRVTVQKINETRRPVVVDELVKAGANDVQGVAFAVKDSEKLLDEAQEGRRRRPPQGQAVRRRGRRSSRQGREHLRGAGPLPGVPGHAEGGAGLRRAVRDGRAAAVGECDRGVRSARGAGCVPAAWVSNE